MSHIGLTVPKLLPIAGTWALPFAAYNALLSTRIFATRIRTRHYIGDALPASSGHNCKTQLDGSPYPDELTLASRSHVNFLENVPLAFVFLTVAELNGADRKVLNYVMASFLALRIAHVELGLRSEGTAGWGRPIGYIGSLLTQIGLATYAGWLVRSFWF